MAGGFTRSPHRCVRRLVFLLLLFGACAAPAGSFTANPVRLTLPPGAMSTSLLLENKGDEPVLVQAELMAWSQQNGQDVLTPTEDLVVSPPIFRMAPGASQTVRIGLLKPVGADREVTYRIFLQEVAQPLRAGQQGVQVALRLALPIFILPKQPAAARATWRAKEEKGEIALSVTNSGNTHMQALDCTLTREDGTVIAQQQLGAYVLAGQTRTWRIKPTQPWTGPKLTLMARTNLGEQTAEVIRE